MILKRENQVSLRMVPGSKKNLLLALEKRKRKMPVRQKMLLRKNHSVRLMETKRSPTKRLQTPRRERDQRASVSPRRRRGPDLATRGLLLTEVPVDLEDQDHEKEETLTLSTMKSMGGETGAVEGPDLVNVDLISKTRWSE